MVKCEKPSPLLPPRYRPLKSFPYRVNNGDSFVSVANRLGMTPKALLLFNFNTDNPLYINYYLRYNVGCTVPTPDGKNYTFTNANPGIIYYPEVAPVQFFGTMEAGTSFTSTNVHGLIVDDRGDWIYVGAAFGVALVLNPKILDPRPFVYRQYIKGQCRVQDEKGNWHDFFHNTSKTLHTLPSAMTKADLVDWSPTDFKEDAEWHENKKTGSAEVRKYGYRQEKAVDIDKYLPNQAGHSYQCTDLPHILVPKTNLRNPKIQGPPSGRIPKAIEVEYHFRGCVLSLWTDNLTATRVWRTIDWSYPRKRWRIKTRYPLVVEEY